MRKTYSSFKVVEVPVTLIGRKSTMEIIKEKISDKKNKELFHVVTAYSEFFVRANKEKRFHDALLNSSLIIPDGVGVLGAIDYLKSVNKNDFGIVKIFKGFLTGFKIITGKVGETVSGVYLFRTLVEEAFKNEWKVYLLGGFNDTAKELASRLILEYPNIKIGFDPGVVGTNAEEMNGGGVIDRINSFKPDLLFVAYGPGKQEEWIYKNKSILNTRVAIGVGGTFNELLGKEVSCPEIVARIGLKWLWRLIFQPSRWKRIYNATFVFLSLVVRQAFD